MKNNVDEHVILSPQEFTSPIDELNEARLYMLANERMAHYSAEQTISQQQIDDEFGFNTEDMSDSAEVEFE